MDKTVAAESKHSPSHEVTRDVCEADFPPENFGDTPRQVEQTIGEVIERVFRDKNGSIRSGVYGRTMKPLRDADIQDRRGGVGCFPENAVMPNELKPLWLNYENSNYAGGKYIEALLAKHSVTGEARPLALARRTFQSFVQLWENVARDNPYGRGWMPKPYGGIHDVGSRFEGSADQYTYITLGLEAFYREAADEDERRTIRRMVLSFADWWIDHDFTHNFMGGMLWYKRLAYPHVIGWFLYINALAYSFDAKQRYEDAFRFWLQKTLGLSTGLKALGISTEQLVRQLERLIQLRPEHAVFWRAVMRDTADFLIELASQKDNMAEDFRGKFQFNGHLAGCLPAADRVFAGCGYAEAIQQLLLTCHRRSDFYHVSRGVRVCDLDSRAQGDDYRNTFFAEGQISWLNGYWYLRSLNQPAETDTNR